jgi:hypothetical protein
MLTVTLTIAFPKHAYYLLSCFTVGTLTQQRYRIPKHAYNRIPETCLQPAGMLYCRNTDAAALSHSRTEMCSLS